ncbi:putative receptor protein kinase ZmPK1 [Hordeum vulgare]|nr:putative receptor protein kinase ZmPK1 [Hordeum vulgare]
MDAHTGASLTPLYNRDPPAAAAASAENPSAAAVGAGAAAAAGAPSTVGLARSLFLPPRMTTPTDGVAPAPSRAAAAPLERKKGKTSAKKKTTDGSGSSKPKKKVAVRQPGAASTEAPTSSLVEPAADAHHVFDEIPPSLNDDAYMSTMGVGSNNSHWSQTNDIHLDDHEFEVDKEGEGIIEAPKGRAGNYTTNDDKLLCNTWLQVSRDPSVGGDQSRDAYWGRMKEHFDAQNDKTEKKKRKGDDELTNAMEAIVKARKEANEVRKMTRNQDAAAEERRLVAEERRVAAEERKVALEEGKVGMEERAKLLEWEKHLFFLDTSLFNDAQKKYVNLVREEVLIQKRAMIRTMGGGGLGGMGGGGLGAMGGMGLGAMGAMGGGVLGGMGGGGFGAMGAFGAPSNAMGGMGGMGAPPVMGGMSFDVPHTHTHENAVEDLAKTVGATRDAVGDEVREEDSSSKTEESSSEEEEDDEEDD